MHEMERLRANRLLARQLSSPVRWIHSMETVSENTDGPLLEVGPGKVLSGLMKRIVADVDVTPLGDIQALEAV